LQGKHKWATEVLDDQQFTAKIRDKLLGYNICDNTFKVILTTIYMEGQRVKEMSGECGRDTNPSQRSVLICKASTNGEWRFRTTSQALSTGSFKR
jgi:hypothetical protein